MSSRSRCLFRAGLALIVTAVVGVVAIRAMLPQDPLEAARGRVPLGADLEAVEAAVGWPADFSGRPTAVADDPRRVLGWEDGEDQLLVEFDGEGRAVKAGVYRWRDQTLWDRCRAWLGG
jgi:hypothetical protein